MEFSEIFLRIFWENSVTDNPPVLVHEKNILRKSSRDIFTDLFFKTRFFFQKFLQKFSKIFEINKIKFLLDGFV